MGPQSPSLAPFPRGFGVSGPAWRSLGSALGRCGRGHCDTGSPCVLCDANPNLTTQEARCPNDRGGLDSPSEDQHEGWELLGGDGSPRSAPEPLGDILCLGFPPVSSGQWRVEETGGPRGRWAMQMPRPNLAGIFLGNERGSDLGAQREEGLQGVGVR